MRLAPSPFFVLLFATAVSCGDDRLKGFGDDDAEPQQACTTALDCDAGEACESGFCACRSVECLGKPTSPGTDDGGGSGGGTGGGTGGGGGGGTGTGTGGGGGGGGTGGGTTTGPQPPYLGGQWNTEYHLDWSDYLGPLGDLGTPLDIVDQLFMGTSEIASLPIAGPIIQEIIDQYVPSWLVDLVHILNNVVHFFEDVRIHGRMVLTHVNGQPLNMTATENWEWGYVRIIDQCPRGESDPNYPACAEFAVPLNLFTADFGSIRAEAKPFTGAIAGGPTTYSATFGGRRVEMEISRFVQFVLDHVVELASNGQYDTFGESLVSLFDCESVAYDMSAFLCNNFNSCGQLHTIEQACLWSVNAGVATLMQKLDEIDADWEVMRFDAQAGIVYDATSRYASKLGLPTAPGTIANGEFEVLMGADLTGTWSGKRP